MPRKLNLTILKGSYAICRLDPGLDVPSWARSPEFLSITRTAEELSIVCVEHAVPEAMVKNRGWRCLKVQGPIDFSEVGIVASLVRPLADAGISVFVISTFDTDYLMVREPSLEPSVSALREVGHVVREDEH